MIHTNEYIDLFLLDNSQFIQLDQKILCDRGLWGVEQSSM